MLIFMENPTQKKLTPEEESIIVYKATETPFTGKYSVQNIARQLGRSRD